MKNAITTAAFAVCFAALLMGSTGEQNQSQPSAIAELAFIYPLDTCPVSDEELGSMGEPVVKTYEVEGGAEREVRFCCKGCIADFEKDQAKYWKEIDEKIIEQQKEHYPLETCIVSGEEFGSGGMGEPFDFVYRNRLVRLCCEGCLPDFEADPDKHLATLDEAIKKAERAKYPLKTCVVSGEELGSMGAPVEVIAANRLMLFCCKGCIPDFKKDPAQALSTLEEAWKEANAGDGVERAALDGESGAVFSFWSSTNPRQRPSGYTCPLTGDELPCPNCCPLNKRN